MPPPQAADGRVARVPPLGKVRPLLFGLRLRRGPVVRFQIPRHRLALYPTHIVQARPHQVQDAELHLHLRGVLQSVQTRDQDILDAPGFQIRQHLRPELRAFVRRRPQPQHVLLSIEINADGHVHCPVIHPPFVSHLHHLRVQKHNRFDRLLRPVLPRRDLLQHRVGDFGNQRRTHLHGGNLFDVTLDFARRHPACVHRQNLVVEAGKPRLVLGHRLRLECAIAIPGHRDLGLSELALDGLPRRAVAGVAAAPARRIVLPVAQMAGQPGVERPLDHSADELFQQPLLANPILRAPAVAQQLDKAPSSPRLPHPHPPRPLRPPRHGVGRSRTGLRGIFDRS